MSGPVDIETHTTPHHRRADGDAGALARGETVGRYLVLAKRARGGMGVVYLAYDPELDRKVALKLLRPLAPGKDEEKRAEKTRAHELRLLQEAKTLAKLSHPNIVAVHDVGTANGRVFVAMEWIEGETVTEYLARVKPDWETTLSIFLAAGRGLAAAHQAGLVHRDVKPGNVMIEAKAGDAPGRVVMMDFGIAVSVEADSSSTGGAMDSGAVSRSSQTDRLTMTGTLMGTPAYMAPEQHMRLPVDERSDQFGFCVAVFEALAGFRPFEGSNARSVAQAITAGEVR